MQDVLSRSNARSLSVGGTKSRRSLLSKGYFSIKLYIPCFEVFCNLITESDCTIVDPSRL